MVLRFPFPRVEAVCAEVSAYKDWIFRGINGSPGNPRDFLVLMRHLEHFYSGKRQIFLKVSYDLDLPVFRREGQALYFKYSSQNISSKASQQQREYLISLSEQFGGSLAVDKLNFKISVSKYGVSQSYVRFVSQTRFAYIVDLFFDMEKYKKNVEWRILQIIRNFVDHISKSK